MRSLKFLLYFFPLLAVLTACNLKSNAEQTPNQSKTEHLGTKATGLPNQIWAIYQDKKGNYWFGSNGDGLYKYDGKSLVQLTEKDGLLDNQIRKIQEDKAGNIYIESGRGVCKFDGKNFTILIPIISTENKWRLDPDDLWFSLSGSGNHIYRYDGQNMYELKLPKQDLEKAFGPLGNTFGYSPYTVFGIDKDKAGNLWIGTILAGAFRYDGADFIWFGEKELSRLEDGREPGVRSLLEDKNGHFWLSNTKSRYILDAEAENGQYTMQPAIPAQERENDFGYFLDGLSDQRNGDLWFVFYGDGVWRFDGRKLSHYPVKIGSQEALLYCIHQDHAGDIWLGAQNGSVLKLRDGIFEEFQFNL